MRTKYRQWAVDYLDLHPEVVLKKVNFEDEYFKTNKIVFEIGSGKGDFIVAISKENPDVHYLAVEKVPTVAGIMSKKIVDEGIQNVKVFANDVFLLFDQIKDETVDIIYLNFVDPWPKKRHEKRRLTFPKFLEQYYRILKKDGLLIFKSDNDGLYEYTVEVLEQTKFVFLENLENYEFNPTNDAMTEYERKFRNVNKSIHRIVVKK